MVSVCLGITWSLEVLNRINFWNKTAKPGCVLIISLDILQIVESGLYCLWYFFSFNISIWPSHCQGSSILNL